MNYAVPYLTSISRNAIILKPQILNPKGNLTTNLEDQSWMN